VKTSTVFCTAILAPTSVVPYDGVILVSAAPDILFLKDTDGDGHADVREVLSLAYSTSEDLYPSTSLFWATTVGLRAGRGRHRRFVGARTQTERRSLPKDELRFRPRDAQVRADLG